MWAGRICLARTLDHAFDTSPSCPMCRAELSGYLAPGPLWWKCWAISLSRDPNLTQRYSMSLPEPIESGYKIPMNFRELRKAAKTKQRQSLLFRLVSYCFLFNWMPFIDFSDCSVTACFATRFFSTYHLQGMAQRTGVGQRLQGSSEADTRQCSDSSNFDALHVGVVNIFRCSGVSH